MYALLAPATRAALARIRLPETGEGSSEEGGESRSARAPQLSKRLFLVPHLGHVIGGFATTLYFHYLDPWSYGGLGEAGPVTPRFLLFIVLVAGAVHGASGLLHGRRLGRLRTLASEGPRAEGVGQRERLASAIFKLPGEILRDTVAIWLVMGTFVSAFAALTWDLGLLRILQIFFGTALVGGSLANLTGYLLADAAVRREVVRLVGALDSLAEPARLKLPRLLLAFLLIVGLLPVSVVAWLAFGYGQLLAGTPEAADLVTRLIRGGLFVWLVTVAVTVICMVWIVRGMIRPLSRLTDQMSRIAAGDFHIRIPVSSDDDIGQIASSFNRMARELAQRERIREMFGRYVSEGVLDQLLRGELELRLGGERREVAILFADIRGSTALAETQPPERTMEVVNAYFEAITTPVHAEGGTILEYLGDGVLAVFGAPLSHEDAPARAVRASLEIRRKLDALRRRHREQGVPAPEVGLGIHYGPVVVGNLGSNSRMKYGVIGDTVNVAARIQSLSRDHPGAVLISDAVRLRLGHDFNVTPLGEVKVKGRAGAIELHRVS